MLSESSDQTILTSMQSNSSPSLFMSQGSLNSLPMHFQDPTGFAGLAPPLGPASQIDPNSPALFKHNIHIAQEQVLRIQQLAQSAIEAMYVV